MTIFAHFFTELIQSVRMADLFDVAIISALIYLVLVWFEATASRFVLIGIFVLGAVYFLARVFHLYLTAIVLQAFFAIFLIALVVIFQEELRRFFERLSIWGMIRRPNVLSGYPEIEIISTTLNKMARKRIGALLVIRGVDPLDRHLEGGYELDGRLSEPLLESIFDPHSLGHDGAAVIEHGRLSKFGCRLPLSNNVRLLGTRGTRHSAALGLAEKTDALCIIVSEETGTISVAQRERLRELEDAAALRGSLERYFLEKFPKGHRTLIRWVKERSWEKAASVLVSCALWFVFVYQTGTIRRDLVLPIEYRNLRPDWVVEEPRPSQVTVTFLGRARAFDLLDMRNLRLMVDASDIEQGTHEVLLPMDSVVHPSSLSVVDIDPDKARVTAYQLVQANLPVEVQTHGKAPSGYKISRIEVSPQSIPVLVPSKEKNNSLRVLTETIDLRKIKQTTTLTPSIILPAGARLEGQTQPRVDVKVEVKHTS